jgi:hypothetical protein
MSFLSNLIKQAAPVVATVAPFIPGGQAVAVVASAKVAADQKAAVKYQQALAEQRRRQQMSEFLTGYPGSPSTQAPMVRPTTQQAGFGAGFGEFLGDVGRNIISPFANIATTVAPFFGRSVAQQPAVTTTRSAGGQETQGSGSIQAGLGGLAGQALQQAGRFLRTPGGQIGTGLFAGGAINMMGSQTPGMRITRKMKSQARTVLNMVGGDLSAASQILGINEEMLVQVLLKRFRNDGPVVTKAALRKTKQTVRRLKSMCDMYDSLRPTATRRRAPMKRASSTTLIKN